MIKNKNKSQVRNIKFSNIKQHVYYEIDIPKLCHVAFYFSISLRLHSTKYLIGIKDDKNEIKNL